MSSRKRAPAQKNHRPARMPGLLLAAGLLLALAGLAWGIFSALAGGTSGSPQLAVNQDEIDFGDVKLGQTVTATFTLTNQGSAPLRFSEQPWVEIKEGC